jgi:hypothetical protein
MKCIVLPMQSRGMGVAPVLIGQSYMAMAWNLFSGHQQQLTLS